MNGSLSFYLWDLQSDGASSKLFPRLLPKGRWDRLPSITPLICMCILLFSFFPSPLELHWLHWSFFTFTSYPFTSCLCPIPCIFKYRERWPWSFKWTQNLLQISWGIQYTCEFINTDLEPCLPSSIRVTCQGQRMPNTSPFSYFSPFPSGLPLLSPCLLHEVSDSMLSSLVHKQYPAL